ncbi:putative chaperone protein HSP31 [Monoraphidium neglectum]|uniref:Putative chaperone protein HSP31 n=1 Tax=Monoraphidium neglectum TaxID=145388 RepID=A0A0D2LVH5_9CHLO|nr:putative chaperone protein HSP31 [Monoraphidium neglectum]KIY95554.1 putative chaperone protein HSP31 [Monoraphidium neglectum]|eukprot:XP_013894574.1 putative chaperone protein HSP31 [Monoraphidium neglectum]
MSTKAVHESEISKAAVVKGQVLMVATSCDKFSDGTPTGLWISELADPFYTFKSQGYDVTIASPKGGAVPIDPTSQGQEAMTPEAHRFVGDAEASQQLKSSVPLSSVKQASSYDCIYLPGGHGPVFDLAEDQTLARLLSEAFGAGKVVAAVCHGPAGLLSAKDPKSGKALVAGRKVTSFTTEEEKAVGKDGKVPYLLDARLAEAGAHFTRGPAWGVHVETDGGLVTGQNPASAAAVAEAALRVMAGSS